MMAVFFVILLSITWCQCSGTTIQECNDGTFLIKDYTVNLTCEGVKDSLFWDFKFLTDAIAFDYDCSWRLDTCQNKDGNWYAVTRPQYNTSTLTLRMVTGGPRIEGTVRCGAQDAINYAAQCEVKYDSTLKVLTTTPSTTTVKTQTPSTAELQTTPKPPPTTTAKLTEKTTTSTPSTTTQPTTSAPRTTPPPPPPQTPTTTTREKQSTNRGVITTTQTRDNKPTNDDNVKTTTSSINDNDGLPIVAIAAGAGGGLILLLIVVVIIIVLLKRRKGSSDMKSRADEYGFVEHINLLYESSDVPHAYARPPPRHPVLTNHNAASSPRDARPAAEDESEDSYAGYSTIALQPNSGPGQENNGSTHLSNGNGKGGNSAEAGAMFSPDPAPDNSMDVYAVVNKPKSRARTQPGTQSDVYENVQK